MSYKSIISKVAKEFNTTPEEVDYEIREAIRIAGLDISPELFIAMSAAKVKRKINNSNNKNGKV